MQFHSNILHRTLCMIVLACASYSALAESVEDTNFPTLDSSYLKTGDFVGPDHVKRITPGLNKDQVRLQLGNPHFSEGIFNVREWNYAFNFYTGKNSEYVTCQYKVKFDGGNRVVSTHWKNSDCESYINPVATKSVAVIAPTLGKPMVLAADGLFAFGKSGMNDLAVPGRETLDTLVSHLKQDKTLVSIMVIGYTDRIGTATANLALSQARAETIRAYFAQQGLDEKLIRAVGAGDTKPIVECEGSHVTPQLVQCLQPNRRVEIQVVAQE